MRLAASIGAALLLCWMLSGSAPAREVQVLGDQARLRDLLPGSAITDPSDPLLDMPVITDLIPGERRLLTPAEMLLRLSQVGVDAEARGWHFLENVTVTRRCQVVSAEEMVRAGEEAIRGSLELAPGDEATVAVVRKPRALLAPAGELALRASAEPPRLPGGLWHVAVSGEVQGASAVNCDLRYRLTVIGEALVTNRSVRRHDMLDASDVAFARRDLSDAARRSRCCLYLSDDDRGPLALAEILLAGCPAIGVPTGAPFIRPGRTGILIDRFRPQACLDAVADCHQLDRHTVAAAAARQFHTARIVERILRALDQARTDVARIKGGTEQAEVPI